MSQMSDYQTPSLNSSLEINSEGATPTLELIQQDDDLEFVQALSKPKRPQKAKSTLTSLSPSKSEKPRLSRFRMSDPERRVKLLNNHEKHAQMSQPLPSKPSWRETQSLDSSQESTLSNSTSSTEVYTPYFGSLPDDEPGHLVNNNGEDHNPDYHSDQKVQTNKNSTLTPDNKV